MGLTLESCIHSNTSKKDKNQSNMDNIREILKRSFMIENLYMKFILTVIAIALIVIAIELNTHLSNLTHVVWRLYQVS